MKKLILLTFILMSGLSMAQGELSDKAEISLITCGPNPDELYSAFGHTALRVHDPIQGIDLVFNYGIFDFDQPNFYLNFARGNLLYMLAVNRWVDFLRIYRNEGRFVREQQLNLSQAQKEAYWLFLKQNARPENRDYYYDYFYDNCATRVRDGLETALGMGVVQFKEKSYYQPSLSIRELCDIYLQEQAWGDFAIDFCLGLPMDKKANSRIEMYLPDLLAEAFANATVLRDGNPIPLVKSDVLLLKQEVKGEASWLSPLLFWALFLVLGVVLTMFNYEKPRTIAWFDILWSGLLGLLGFFLLGLWLLTNHKAAAWNFNLLLFNPLWLMISWSLLRGKWSKFSKLLLKYSPYLMAILLGSWIWLPQELHLSLMPLTALIILRTWHLTYKGQNAKKPLQ